MFNIPSGAVGSQFLFAGIRFTLAGILTILFGSILSKKILVPKKEIRFFSVFKTFYGANSFAVCVFLHRLGELHRGVRNRVSPKMPQTYVFQYYSQYLYSSTKK